MIYKGSIFVHDIIKNVFKISLTAERYRDIGGLKCSRNIFSNCILQNSKFLGDNYKVAIKTLIMNEIKDNNKKEMLFKYLIENLPNDVEELIIKSPDDVEKIVDLTISKFSNDGSKDDKKKIEMDIKEITELYIKATKYMSNDKIIAFQLFLSVIEKIIEYIAENEEIKFLNNGKNNSNNKMKFSAMSYKNVMPKSILLMIEQVYKMMKIKDTSNSYNELIELIYINNQKILKWFIEDYLNQRTYFSIIDNKANEIFNNEQADEDIKVFGVDDLKKMGWSLKDIAKKTTEAFNKNIPLRSDNVSRDEEAKIARIKYNPSTRKILLNKKNEVIGYWVFTTLFDEAFQKAKEGNLKTSDLNPTKIKLLIPGNIYNIEFGATLLIDDYRNPYGYKMLIFSIIEYFEKMALDDMYINEIVTKSSCEDGIGFITSMGLKFYKKHQDGKTLLFHGSVKDLLEENYLKKFTLLRRLYSKKFADVD